jgi:CheY-like chemotaxis protein
MPKRVLYVEDNANTAMALKVLLQLKGYSVETAATVKDAVDVLAREKFDVVISDISLPDGQGWEVLKHSPGVRSIAISG